MPSVRLGDAQLLLVRRVQLAQLPPVLSAQRGELRVTRGQLRLLRARARVGAGSGSGSG